jgi:hypothetical protein
LIGTVPVEVAILIAIADTPLMMISFHPACKLPRDKLGKLEVGTALTAEAYRQAPTVS